MVLEPLPQGEAVRLRKNSQPQMDSAKGANDGSPDSLSSSRNAMEIKMADNSSGSHLGLSRGMSPRARRISNEIKRAAAYANLGNSEDVQAQRISRHASVDVGARRGNLEELENEDAGQMQLHSADKDRTMRPPSRRPIPLLPSSPGFSP